MQKRVNTREWVESVKDDFLSLVVGAFAWILMVIQELLELVNNKTMHVLRVLHLVSLLQISV